MGRTVTISDLERDLDRAVERCIETGLELDLRLTDRGIEIPYIELSDGMNKGHGIGSAAIMFVLSVADEHGVEVLVPPISDRSIRFFGRHGFAWPDEEVECPETDLLMMVRPADPKIDRLPSVSP